MGADNQKKIIYVVAEDWYFLSHRLALAKAALAAGYEVSVATRVHKFRKRIEQEGIRVIPLQIYRRSLNPWTELRTLRDLLRIYRIERPVLVHHVAVKPVIYGTIAARLVGIHAIVNAIAGLGYVFSSTQWLARLLQPLVRLAYRLLLNHRSVRTIVQNPDDRELLVNAGLGTSGQVVLIRGSGVDINEFHPRPEAGGRPMVILPGRMLWEKGVGEFVEAARQLRREGISADFVLVGPRDDDNPSSVPMSQLVEWQEQGIMQWWGYRSDMTDVLTQAHIVVLPSYREGLPKALIEAAACERALVSTDVPGCREIVRNEENGILVPPRDSAALAQAIRRLIQNSVLRHQMGKKGRKLVVAEFATERVSAETLSVYAELLA